MVKQERPAVQDIGLVARGCFHWIHDLSGGKRRGLHGRPRSVLWFLNAVPKAVRRPWPVRERYRLWD
jgi:hypothetical protein